MTIAQFITLFRGAFVADDKTMRNSIQAHIDAFKSGELVALGRTLLDVFPDSRLAAKIGEQLACGRGRRRIAL